MRAPHRHHLLVEHTPSGPGGGPGNQVILHTFWGGRLNRPFAMALEAAWEDRFAQHIDIQATNDCIVLMLPHAIDSDELLSLVSGTNIEDLLRSRLAQSGFLGARFREAAGRALLLTKRKINERMPLWLTRLQSQRLLSAVSEYDDFPILLEAWRSCLTDAFDLDNLQMVLAELASGAIAWTEIRSKRPSPLGQSVSWQQINRYMYRDDSPLSGTPSKLNRDLIHDLVMSPHLRPSVSPEIVERYETKRQRLYPGYSPDSSAELLDWVKERVVIPKGEWEALCRAIQRDHDLDAPEVQAPLGEKLLWIIPREGGTPLMVARESARGILEGLYGVSEKDRVTRISRIDGFEVPDTDVLLEDLPQTKAPAPPAASDQDFREGSGGDDHSEEIIADILGEWFQFYGPRTADFIQATLGIDRARLNVILDAMIDAGRMIAGPLVSDGPENLPSFCDSENYGSLLRMKRAAARPAFEAVAITTLAPYLARIQGIMQPGGTREDLAARIEQLQCYEAAPELWEKEIFPARLIPYDPSWLDSIMQETDLIWIGKKEPGAGGQKSKSGGKVTFTFESDLDLLEREKPGAVDGQGDGAPSRDISEDIAPELFPQGAGRLDFSTLLQTSGLLPQELSGRLWELVWGGIVTNDTFIALRRGIENRFDLPDQAAPRQPAALRRRSRGKSRFSKWKNALASTGYWYVVRYPEPAESILESEELKRERIRILLDRYGILFRELLLRELPGFRWSDLFRSLRIMELSGEVVTGHFFQGILGPQFISPRGLHMLEQGLDRNRLYWINAMDPASLCGLRLESLKGTLPKRLAGTHLVYRGPDLLLVSTKLGNTLSFHREPADPDLEGATDVLSHLLTRRFQPLRSVTIESINEIDAAESPYADLLRRDFDVVIDYKKIVLYKKRR